MNPSSTITKIRRDIYTKVANWAQEQPLPIEITDEDIKTLAGQLVPCAYYEGRYSLEQELVITEQRVRLTMNKGSGRVINAITEACNSCMFGKNKYFITALCQNCTGQLCRNNCPKDTISIVNNLAVIGDACIGCGKCAHNCPYGAILAVERPCEKACGVGAVKFDECNKVIIDKESCVSCGTCLAACPLGAIDDCTQIVETIQAIRTKNFPVIALPAPALAGQFGPKVTPAHFKAALLKLGFNDVVEVALGADIVAQEEMEEIIERYGEKVMTNSCCPSYLMAIKNKLPKLAGVASHTRSPMRVTGQLVRDNNNGKVITVFIGPCSAKKEEISWGDEIDIVLTFEEMAAIFKASEIDPAKETPVEMNDATNIGRMFAHSGGVVGAVAKLLDLEKYPVKIVHPTTLKGSLRTLKSEVAKAAKSDGFTIVEGMACPAGCISGSGTIVAVNTSNRALTKYINEGRNEK